MGNGLNDQSILDVRKLMSGKDGRLFVTTDAGENIFLAEVAEFTASLDMTNADVQPVGSTLIYAVTTGYSLAISVKEMLVRDDVMGAELIERLNSGWMPAWDFQGAMVRPDGQEQRIVYRNCVLAGSVSLQNLTPGAIVERNWSFRCNATPEMLSQLTGDITL
ncbi:MAG: phage tail tube protein [Eubacteriales bacterium]